MSVDTVRGHKRIGFVCNQIDIWFWLCVICVSIATLTGYILIAKEYSAQIEMLAGAQGVAQLRGECAGIFFAMLFGLAIFIYTFYLIKNFILIKLDYFDDIKYIRDSSAEISKKTSNKVETDAVIKPSFIKRDFYYLFNRNEYKLLKKVSEVDNGAFTAELCNDKDEAICFRTRVEILEYASKYKLDLNGEYIVV